MPDVHLKQLGFNFIGSLLENLRNEKSFDHLETIFELLI